MRQSLSMVFFGNSDLIRAASVKLPQNAEQKISQVWHPGSKELPSGVIFLLHSLAMNIQPGSINTNWRQKNLLSKILLQVDSLKPCSTQVAQLGTIK